MISLQKGQRVSLSKDSGGNIQKVIVGLGWDIAGAGSASFDLDASVLLLQNGKLMGKEDVIYYGHKDHASGAVHHCGDNLTGAGDGDDEQIIVDLQNMPMQYDKIVVIVNIYHAAKKNQHFGQVENAFMHIVDQNSGQELSRFNLTDDYKGCTAMIFGEIYRHGGEWKVSAIGQGTTDPDISSIARRYQ